MINRLIVLVAPEISKLFLLPDRRPRVNSDSGFGKEMFCTGNKIIKCKSRSKIFPVCPPSVGPGCCCRRCSRVRRSQTHKQSRKHCYCVCVFWTVVTRFVHSCLWLWFSATCLQPQSITWILSQTLQKCVCTHRFLWVCTHILVRNYS